MPEILSIIVKLPTTGTTNEYAGHKFVWLKQAFATSLSNFLLFKDDLARRNRIDCAFLSALAHYGQGEIVSAQQELADAFAGDPDHLAALEIARWIRAGAQFAAAKSEALRRRGNRNRPRRRRLTSG